MTTGSLHSLLEDAQALLTGTLLVAFAIVLFRQAGLLTGGTPGLAFLAHYASGISFGALYFLINIPFYIFGFMAIGFAHSFLWLRQQISGTPLALFAYAISLYPLAMSMFEDAYFSSPGFWVMLWIPPAALYLYRLLAAKSHGRRPAAFQIARTHRSA